MQKIVAILATITAIADNLEFTTKNIDSIHDIIPDESNNNNDSHKNRNNNSNSVDTGRSDSNFIWGTGTASYQIEGGIKADGRLPTIWDTFCNESGKVYNGESGKYADNSYYLYERDAQLLDNLGVTHYRMSLAWSRILPDGHTLNMKGINHYIQVFKSLEEYNIVPVVTLYHWDLPQIIYDETNGGWINSTIVNYYLRYAKTVFKHFSNYSTMWATFNEPWTFCVEGYQDGVQAPGRCSDHTSCTVGGNSSTEPYLCAHNVLLAHAHAVNLFRSSSYNYNQNGQSKIGMNLNINGVYPANDASDEDINAAQRNYIWNGAWFADPHYFGDYPSIMKQYVGSRLPIFTNSEKELLKNSIDFFGLNHYNSNWVWKCNNSLHQWSTDSETCISATNPYNGSVIGPQAASTWLYVYPRGIYTVSEWVYNRYMNGNESNLYSEQSIYITENGCDSPNENETHIVLNDTFRVNYLEEYIGYVLEAHNDGLNVNGYFVWSLMDNFEWGDGYSKRFGIHAVNFSSPNFTRIERQSALWYKDFIAHNP